MSKMIVVAITGIASAEDREAITGLLYGLGHEGLEEGEHDIKAYFPESVFTEEDTQTALIDIGQHFAVHISDEVLAEKNWNEDWEKNFPPVLIADWVGLRASFHVPSEGVVFDIVIDPKMSFGTGHHATTSQVISQMRLISFANKKVLDLGSGTGVLAILAAKLGAAEVTAIDNDPWCRENAIENCLANGHPEISVLLGELSDVPGSFDIILANIQRNYLVEHMAAMSEKLLPGGYLFISGFFENEAILLLNAALEQDLTAHYITVRDNWAAIILHKQAI
jgi:ribosomal protein L11 methyltransferase